MRCLDVLLHSEAFADTFAAWTGEYVLFKAQSLRSETRQSQRSLGPRRRWRRRFRSGGIGPTVRARDAGQESGEANRVLEPLPLDATRRATVREANAGLCPVRCVKGWLVVLEERIAPGPPVPQGGYARRFATRSL